MKIGAMIRRVVPQHVRAVMRRSRLVRWGLRRMYGGVREVPHGPYHLFFDGEKIVGWAIAGTAGWESDEVALVRDVLAANPPGCAWDVGANVGFYSLLFAAAGVPRIICFEPDPANVEMLNRNVTTNGIGGVDIRPVGLSSRSGTATFFADPMTGTTGTMRRDFDFIGDYYGGKRTETTITIASADELIAAGTPAPDFMKVDVEGHELDVFTGAERLLNERGPTILVEAAAGGEPVAHLLVSHGYRLMDVASRRWVDAAGFNTLAVHESKLNWVAAIVRG